MFAGFTLRQVAASNRIRRIVRAAERRPLRSGLDRAHSCLRGDTATLLSKWLSRHDREHSEHGADNLWLCAPGGTATPRQPPVLAVSPGR